MGRTLHYNLKKTEGKFTRKEEIAMFNISQFFNSGKYEKAWTCENFWLDTVDFYPNWDSPELPGFIRMRDGGHEAVYNLINRRMADLQKKGLHHIDAVRELEKQGIVKFHQGKVTNEVHGFTKTQGNEFNSLLVLLALIEISKVIPKAEISLRDEGEFLLCPLKIQCGKALPDIDSILDSIKYYFFKMMFSPGFEGNILDKLNYKAEDFTKCLAQDIGFGNSYGDMTNYVNDKLRNLKLINDILIKQGLKDNEFYLSNFEQRELKKWFDPIIFTRYVDVEKFKDYERSPATMMDGFAGEGFGLTDEDAEAKSYRSIATIQNLLAGVGFEKCNLEILPKITK